MDETPPQPPRPFLKQRGLRTVWLPSGPHQRPGQRSRSSALSDAFQSKAALCFRKVLLELIPRGQRFLWLGDLVRSQKALAKPASCHHLHHVWKHLSKAQEHLIWIVGITRPVVVEAMPDQDLLECAGVRWIRIRCGYLTRHHSTRRIGGMNTFGRTLRLRRLGMLSIDL